MISKVFVFAVLAITVSCEAKKIKLVPSYPYIYSLELKFREDKINDYIVDSFFATSNAESDKLLHCDIHLADLIKAIPIKKLSISDFKNALQELNLSYNDDDLNNAISNLDYTELKEIGFSIERVYKSLSKTYFKDRSTELLEFLKTLGIAEEFSVAYTFGTEEDMFNAIRAGNFSYNNLAEIDKFINTPTSLKDLFNILGLKKLNEEALTNFINNKLVPGLIQSGLTEENLKNFLKNLGLTVSSYKDSKVFKKCYSDFTKDKSLAVAVSQSELVTNDDSIIIKYFNLEPYTNLVAKAVEGNGISYGISARNINNDEDNNIIHIQINGPISNFIDKASEYEDSGSENCKYITVFESGLSIQEATINVATDLLSMPKFFDTPFKKGSPLVCGQKLYGLASLEKWNSIIFDYVQEKQQEQIPPHPLPPLIQNKPEVIEAIKEFFESIHASLNPCKYFHCGIKEEEVPSENNSEEEDLSRETSSEDNTDLTSSHEDSGEHETEANESTSEEVGVVDEEGSSQEDVNKPADESSSEDTQSDNVSGNDGDDASPTENSNVESSESNDQSKPEDNDSSDVQEGENGDSSVPQENVEPSEQPLSAEGSEENSSGSIEEEETDETSASQDVQSSEELPSTEEESSEEGGSRNNVASDESATQIKFVEEDTNTIAPVSTEENEEAVKFVSEEDEGVNRSSSNNEEEDANVGTLEKRSI